MANPKISAKKKKIKRKAQTKPSDKPNSWLSNRRLHLIGIFGLAILVYANTFSHDFAQDDAIVITDNMFTTDGISGIPGILNNDTFFGFFKDESKKNLVSGGRYRPLTLVLFALEYELFGQNAPVGHILNVLWYGLSGIMVYLLMLQFFRPKKYQDFAFWVAIITSVLFVVHPIHTEVVANIKGRDEIMTFLLSIVALYFSFLAYRKNNMYLNGLVLICFFLALMAKENAITMLAIVPLSFYFFTKADWKKILIQTAFFLIPAGIFLFIRSSVLDLAPDAPVSGELMNNPFLKWTGNGYIAFTGIEKAATVIYTLGKYLLLLLFPYPLSHDYYPRHIEIMSFGHWQIWLSILVYLGIGIYALIGIKKKDPVSFGILFFLATISIFANVVFPIGTNMSERFLFMPSLGFCLAIAVLGYRSSQKINHKDSQTYVASGLIILSLAFAVLTINRNWAWKDNFTLFSTDIHTAPNSAKLRNALGGELLAQAQHVEEPTKTAYYKEAVGHLNQAVAIHPQYKNAFLLLGNAHNYLENYEQSISFYNKALELDPNYLDANINLGITLINNKQPEQAIPIFQSLRNLYPEEEKYTDLLASAYRELGKIYGEQRNDLTNAMKYLEQADQIKPGDYNTIRLMGVAMGVQGNTEASIQYFQKALDLNPNHADAYYNLGTAYHHAGNTTQGQAMIQKAIELDPDILNRMQGK